MGSTSAPTEGTPLDWGEVQAFAILLPPLGLFLIAVLNESGGCFCGKLGNSAAEVIGVAEETGVVTIVRLTSWGRLAEAGDIQGDDATGRVSDDGAPDATRSDGAAAVPHAPCCALRADGVVEDFIFKTRE